MGATGLAAFTLATILSLRPIRQKAFELFLVTHIFLIGYVYFLLWKAIDLERLITASSLLADSSMRGAPGERICIWPVKYSSRQFHLGLGITSGLH